MIAKRGQGNALASFLSSAKAIQAPQKAAAHLLTELTLGSEDRERLQAEWERRAGRQCYGATITLEAGEKFLPTRPVVPEFERLDVGIHYDIPAAHYHADCAIEPSLSASFAQTMLDGSPKRAWAGHPRLNPGAPPWEPTLAMDEGSILHRLILGVGPEFTVLDFKDYKTKAAKEARLAARAAGTIPVLAENFDELENIAAAARRAIEDNDEDRQVLTDDYASEVTCISRVQSGALLRCRPDRLHKTDGSAPVYDFKFTDRLDHPTDWDRAIVSQGWDMRAAFYTRALCELRDGEEPPYRFIVVEKKFPVDVMIFELTESFLKQGHQKAAAAIDGWERCMAAGYWPGHPRRVFHVEEPRWAKRSLGDKLYFLSGILPGGRMATPPSTVTTLREFALGEGRAAPQPMTIDNEDPDAGVADEKPAKPENHHYDSPLE